MKKENTYFDFWRENKLNSHFKLSELEIVNQFRNWLQMQKLEWIDYYNSDVIIREFITRIDGLNSVFEQEQYTDIYKLLKPEIISFRQQIKTKQS